MEGTVKRRDFKISVWIRIKYKESQDFKSPDSFILKR